MPTYPLTFPTSRGLQDAKMSLSRKTSVATSPFTGAEQRSEWPFSKWVIEATVPELDGDEVATREWRSFILELRGQWGTFNMPVPGITGPSSDYVGAIGAVNGASQTGNSVVTDSWTASTLIMNRGDYFMLGTELKMCMANISSDALGDATIVFEPAIKVSPANVSSVILNNPYAIMRLNNDVTPWSVKKPLLHKFSFDATEV